MKNKTILLILFLILIANLSLANNIEIVKNKKYMLECNREGFIKKEGFNFICKFFDNSEEKTTKKIMFCFNDDLKNIEIKKTEFRDEEHLDNKIEKENKRSEKELQEVEEIKNINLLTSRKTIEKQTENKCYEYETDLNKEITLKIYPKNISKSNKFDVYIIDNLENDKTLILDPIYNLTLYTIGSNEKTYSNLNYYWGYYDYWSHGYNIVNNYDINTTTANLYINKISTKSENKSIVYSYGTEGIFEENINDYYEYISITTGMSYSNCQTEVGSYCVYAIFSDNTNQTIHCRTFDQWTTKTIPFNIYPKNISKIITDIKMSTYCWANDFNLELYIKYGSYTETENKTNATLYSNPIFLPIFVNSFKIDANYSGEAYINLSFDNINYFYLNLSNNSNIILLDNIYDNNNLSYKLYLGNETSIYYLNINLNGISNNITFNIYDEQTKNFLNKNTTITLTRISDGIQYEIYTNNTTSTTNIPVGDYYIVAEAEGYSKRNMKTSIGTSILQTLNIYMPNSSYSSLIRIYLRDMSDNIIQNANVTIYKAINSSYVPIEITTSDYTGIIYFNAIDGDNYRFKIEAPNYENKIFDMNLYYINSPYYIRLTKNISQTTYYNYLNNIYLIISPASSEIENNKTNETFSFYVQPMNSTIIEFQKIKCENYEQTSTNSLGTFLYINYNFTKETKVVCEYNVVFSNLMKTYNYTTHKTYFKTNQKSIYEMFKQKNISKTENKYVFAYFIIFISSLIVFGIFGSGIVSVVIAILGIVFFAVLNWINPVVAGLVCFTSILLIFYNRI